MNLLKDKREQENELPKPERDIFDHFPTTPDNPTRRPVRSNKNRDSRSSSLQMLLVASLVLFAVLLGYYVGVVKPKQAMKATAFDESVVAESAGEKTVSQEKGETAKTAAVSDKELPKEAVSVQPETEEIAINSRAHAAAWILSSAVRALFDSGRVTAFILDDQSFSLEIQSSNEAQSIVDAFSSALPPNVSVNNHSSHGQTLLITGTVSGSGTGSELSSYDAWKGKVEQISAKTGLQIINVSSLQTDRLVFAKFRGSIGGCLDFLKELAKDPAKLTIDKIILSAIQGSDYFFVLHVQV